MTQAPDQVAIVRFLEQEALGGPVERIDTHGAIVLLAGEQAFKLKRAVRFSFSALMAAGDVDEALRRILNTVKHLRSHK